MMGLSEAHRQAEALFESQTVVEIREACIQDVLAHCNKLDRPYVLLVSKASNVVKDTQSGMYDLSGGDQDESGH